MDPALRCIAIILVIFVVVLVGSLIHWHGVIQLHTFRGVESDSVKLIPRGQEKNIKFTVSCKLMSLP
jgi:hypothetical protein